MKSVTRLETLSKLVTEYGEASYINYQAVRALGDAVIGALSDYLGSDAQVWGVPPVGDWKPHNYNDAKYSTFGGGLLEIEPIRMGIALAIPHLNDDGELWMRITVEFECAGSEIRVQVIDAGTVASRDFSEEDVQTICALIYDQIVAIWKRPLDLGSPMAGNQGKIGFFRPG